MNNFKKSLERLKLIVLIAPVLSFSCTNKGQILIKVSETANIKRSLEYIEISWETKSPPLLTEKFSLKEPDGSLIEGQIINIKETPPGLFWVSAVFPVAIDANESKEYIVIRQESRLEPFLKVKGKSIGVTVENDHFIADLSTNTETYTPSYPGQIRSVTLKNFNNKILKRSKNNMHCSPNFQVKGLDGFKGLRDIENPDSVSIIRGPYKTIIFKKGKIDGYPLTLSGKYEFYAGLPYYIFSSEVYLNDSISLSLLRNDEMTIDSLFTHVIYKNRFEDYQRIPLYDSPTIYNSEKKLIADDAPFIGFYNEDLNYGYGCIRLEYDNYNSNGGQSPFSNPYTKISKGREGGRYWNRMLIYGEEEVMVPKGSNYKEKNAYLIFDIENNIEEQIRVLNTKILNPLKITYENQ